MGTIISSIPNKNLSIFKVDGFTAITGTTANTLTGSILIPENSITPTAEAIVAELTVRAIKTGVVGIATLRVYANTTDNLTGAILLATGAMPTGADLYQQLERTMFIGKSPIYTKVASTTFGLYSDNNRATAESTVVVDWSQNQFIILAIQNASALDTSTGSGIIFKIYK